MSVNNLKHSYLEFLKSQQYDWNIVLNPKRADKADQSRIRAEEFFKRLDRALLGRKWIKKRKYRVEAAYWREFADDVPHIHALVKFNAPDLPKKSALKSIMIEEWGKLDNIGKLYAVPVESLPKSISYNMKQIRSEKDLDNFFFYPWGGR